MQRDTGIGFEILHQNLNYDWQL